MCLFAKRLKKRVFVEPPLVDGGAVLSPALLALPIDSVDWRRTAVPPQTRVPTPASNAGRSMSPIFNRY
jgi:transposase